MTSPLLCINQILHEVIQLNNLELLAPLGPELLVPVASVGLLSPADQLDLPSALQSTLDMSKEPI